MPRRLCAGLFAQFLLVARASSLCAVWSSFGKGLCVGLPFAEVCMPHPLPPYGNRGMLGCAYAMPHVCGSADLCHVALTMLLSYSLKKE